MPRSVDPRGIAFEQRLNLRVEAVEVEAIGADAQAQGASRRLQLQGGEVKITAEAFALEAARTRGLLTG